MIPHKFQERVRTAEAWMVEAFGTTHSIYLSKTKKDPLGTYVEETLRILEAAKVRTLVQQWRQESGFHSTRGRKQYIDECAALGVMLIQMRIDGDLRFNNMADTILRLDDQQREALGIRLHDTHASFWYDRLWRAVSRLQRLIDPHPGNRHKRPSREEYRAILAAREPEDCERKRERLSALCNALLDASVQLMPRELRRRFIGNTALDATKIPLNGWLGGPSNMKPNAPHRSVNYDGGWYVRNGDHDGSNSTSNDKREWAIEAEITTMTANTPGEAAEFPLLANGVSFHKPGMIAGEGRRLVASLIARGYPIRHFIADRAYLPRSKPADLQAPLRDIGARLVFDYDYDERGLTAYYEDLIQVGGQWYLDFMPDDNVNAHALFDASRERAAGDKQKIQDAKELRDQRIQGREPYRAKPKGRHRPDGSRQYMYPNPKQYGYTAFDKVTGEERALPLRKTIVIPAHADKQLDRALKYGQEYPHDSAKWKAHYGLRNTVESQNAYIKDSATEDIASPMKRRARGNTFASLAVTLALVSANIRKILSFVQEQLARVPRTTKNKSFANTYYSGVELPPVAAVQSNCDGVPAGP